MSFNIHADYNGKITKSDLRKVWLRSIPMEHSWNYERMMHSGYCFAILPILKKLYPNKEDYIKALQRHMELYNVTIVHFYAAAWNHSSHGRKKCGRSKF